MYDYQKQRAVVFTEEGQVLFLKIRDQAHKLLSQAGAFRCGAVLSGCTGDCWDMLACVDRLVELGELVEVVNPTSGRAQARIFTYHGER